MTDYVGPHWGRAGLVVVDLQNDFLDDGAQPVPGTTQVVSRVASLVRAFRRRGYPVAHVIRLYPLGGSDVDLVRRDAVEQGARVVVPGSYGARIPTMVVDVELNPYLLLKGEPQRINDQEAVFYKPRWSAFFRTPLELWLRVRGCDTVVVVGSNLPNSPRATLFDASARDFRTVLVTDAVSQVSAQRLIDLKLIGVHSQPTGEVLAALGA